MAQLPSNKDDGNFLGDESIAHQLSIITQANENGKVLGMITVVYLKDKELSFHIAGEFETLSNQIGMVEQMKDAVKLYARAKQEAHQKAKIGPNWGPGGNA